ncbi:hypothetical protein H696_05449 [Fonticula alba]|uniref:Uncharacterized protein n=1 Tax=Fonticula alba TaxID=691883 RepID=A0A058Z178_FONAL|nr:hypothetical protein H696_05449 [Fonticula alba]KCV67985.1 hypothetical protein H696_05449 [Fonticula alba]|eukprot:XP_009497552.1 hypothetical protein H696_05449 [Fonticula alba]
MASAPRASAQASGLARPDVEGPAGRAPRKPASAPGRAAAPPAASARPAFPKHEADPYDLGPVSNTAGARLLRDIEAGRAPLPSGFQSVGCLRFFLQLVGLHAPAVSLNTKARLMGLDCATTSALIGRFVKDGLGLPPPRGSQAGALSCPHLADNFLLLVHRDPPPGKILLARLLGVSRPTVVQLIQQHAPGVDLTPRPCLQRLRELCAIAPAVPLHQISTLLSVSPLLLKQTMAKYLQGRPHPGDGDGLDSDAEAEADRLAGGGGAGGLAGGGFGLAGPGGPGGPGDPVHLAPPAGRRGHRGIPQSEAIPWPDRLDLLERALRTAELQADSEAEARLRETARRVAIAYLTVFRQDSRLCDQRFRAVRQALPAEQEASLRELLRKDATLPFIAQAMGVPYKSLWNTVVRYFPKPLAEEAPPRPGSGAFLLTDITSMRQYVARYLPEDSPVRRQSHQPGSKPANLLTMAQSSRAIDWRRSDLVRVFDPAQHPPEQPDLRHLDADFDPAFEGRLRRLLALRPPLSPIEASQHLGVSVGLIRRTIDRSLRDVFLSRPMITLPTEGIIRLRRLARQLAGPAAGSPDRGIRRMRYTVPDIARQLGLTPDQTFSLLHRYCPEYFFLALGPEAGAGPGGMYVPDGRLPELLDAIRGRYPPPLVHHLAADLGCTIPQVINSLRVHAPDFSTPMYARSLAFRLHELHEQLRAKPDISLSQLYREANMPSPLLRMTLNHFEPLLAKDSPYLRLTAQPR